MSGPWQPMETAPKEGVLIIASWVESGPWYAYAVGWWEHDDEYEDGGYWSYETEGDPLYWMLVPDAPPLPPGDWSDDDAHD